ncbi:hypothetical protein BJ878DRAFT_494949 [Calycina marina]|uniref:Zinc finger CHCC-type domain-containing protein n=1 Tax=Calycina marina TaxID=1763456 RepID=A0A9P8CH64_9HELO|nr:hypothetical protein BJ878DRAFT_494949 [Calycina marina]
MLAITRSRAIWQASRRIQASSQRFYAFSANENQSINTSDKPKDVPNVSKTNEISIKEPSTEQPLQETVEAAENMRVLQSPNRVGKWSRSQNPRANAMSGPRFEQTIMELQPQPYAAIDLIHKQPVRWSKSRIVECDGGGGPLGHPKIFINTDKPQICQCEYCGLPYANEGNRKYLESLPAESLPFPLESLGDAAEIPVSQRITDEPLGQR